jgi:hypothetical protein
MAWNELQNWSQGELVTAEKMNGQVRDNLRYLVSERGLVQSRYTVTSGTLDIVTVQSTLNWTTVGTGFEIKPVIATNNTRFRVWCSFVASTSWHVSAHFDILADGSFRPVDPVYGVAAVHGGRSFPQSVSFFVDFILTAGMHTFQLQTKTIGTNDGGGDSSISFLCKTNEPGHQAIHLVGVEY